jgi:hypothetical protein
MTNVTQQIEMNGRKYRAVVIADRWQKSAFEYLHEVRGEWREVNNWNTRERLFGLMSEVA